MKFLTIFGICKDIFAKNQTEEIRNLPNGEILNLEYPKILEVFLENLTFYQDSYKTPTQCLSLLKQFNEILGFSYESGSSDYQVYIYNKLNEYSGEVRNFENFHICLFFKRFSLI